MYQQYHQKIHHLLICFQYHPLSLLNVEIDTIWKTILDITAISITLLESFYKVKNSQWWYFAWENLRRVFFYCCIFILSIFFIHISFAFWRHPSPFPGLSPGFYTDFILSTQTIAEWFVRHFHFQPFRYVLTASTMVFEWAFFTQAFFTLHSFTDIFNSTCVYQGLPGSRVVCRASCWSSKHRSGPSVFLIHCNPQTSYSERFNFKFYHTLTWITCGEKFIGSFLTCLELFLLVQSYM